MSVSDKLVKRFAEKNEIELIKILGNNLLLKKGETLVYISIKNDTKDEWIVFYRVVAKKAIPDSKLMEELLRMNSDITPGAFGLQDDNIIFKHCILGGHHMDEDEFLHSLYAVARITDRIISAYDGTTKVIL